MLVRQFWLMVLFQKTFLIKFSESVTEYLSKKTKSKNEVMLI